jgi:hypothetical protein
MAERKYT